MDEMAEEIVPVLRVADAGVAVEWWGRLGFAKVWEHRFEPGFPAFVEVARGRVKVFLSEHTGDAPPGGLVHLRLRTSTSWRPGSRSMSRNSRGGARWS